MPLNKDLREFVESLNANKVDFLVVGAHAVAWHGISRTTKDIDLFVRRGLENGSRIVKAMNNFGFASMGTAAEDFVAEDQILQIGYPPNRIDLITTIAA
jgi:predicted nucleotidyltransferase